MVPLGITMETLLLELSMSSGTLLRLITEAFSGRITLVLAGTCAVKVQYLPVFDVRSGVA